MLFKFNNVAGKSQFGYTEYDKSDGAIAINYTDDDANTAHEMKHAYQHLTGQVEIVEGGIKFADLTDEVESYQRQFHFNSFSMPPSSFGTVTKSRDITIQYVKGIYVLLPNGHKNSLYKDYKV